MSAPVLVCFAVQQEAKPFQQLARGKPDAQVLLTGMGSRNAEAAIRAALKDVRPSRVYTCGFAGGLNPELKLGVRFLLLGTAKALASKRIVHGCLGRRVTPREERAIEECAVAIARTAAQI